MRPEVDALEDLADAADGRDAPVREQNHFSCEP